MVLTRLMICKRGGKTCIVGNTIHLCFRLCRLAQSIVSLPLILARVFEVAAPRTAVVVVAIGSTVCRATAVGALTRSAVGCAATGLDVNSTLDSTSMVDLTACRAEVVVACKPIGAHSGSRGGRA
jgi:hypothetical protein